MAYGQEGEMYALELYRYTRDSPNFQRNSRVVDERCGEIVSFMPGSISGTRSFPAGNESRARTTQVLVVQGRILFPEENV